MCGNMVEVLQGATGKLSCYGQLMVLQKMMRPWQPKANKTVFLFWMCIKKGCPLSGNPFSGHGDKI